MKDLKCALAECVHNRAYCCCAKEIQVTVGADCETFRRDEEKRRNLFETGEDFAKRNYSIDTKVRCDADCIFNRDRLCYANGITVLGDKAHDAICATFMKD